MKYKTILFSLLLILSVNSILNAQKNDSIEFNRQVKELTVITTSIKSKLDSCCKKKKYTKPGSSNYLIIIDTINVLNQRVIEINNHINELNLKIDSCCYKTGSSRNEPIITDNAECKDCLTLTSIIVLIGFLLALVTYLLTNKDERKGFIYSHLKTLFPNLPFVIIVWSIGFCLFFINYSQFSCGNISKLSSNHIIILSLSIGLILLPFIKTIKIGKLIELERNIKETKNDLKEFKSEVSQSLTLLTTTIATSINSLSNQINITLPGTEQVKKEAEKYRDIDFNYSKLSEELALESDDDRMALVRIRIKIESLLRDLLLKRHSNDDLGEIKYMSLNELFRLFLKFYPDKKFMFKSFKYVQQICNAAVHGQIVDNDQTQEVIELGLRIINELNHIYRNGNDDNYSA